MKWYNQLGGLIVGVYFMAVIVWACGTLLDDCTKEEQRFAAWMLLLIVFVAAVVAWVMP